MAQGFFQLTNTLALIAWSARDSVKLGMPWLFRTASLVLILGRLVLRRETAVE
jgi:hypothetical protein